MAGIHAFTNLTMSPDLFGPTGHLVALVGLLGLYPALADRTPTVARVAGAIAAVALGSWALVVATRFFAVLGVISSLSDVLPDAVFMPVFISTILTYVLFSAIILRGDDSSQVVGLLLLAPGVLILVALVGSAIVDVGAREALVISGGLALSMLALGYTLRTGDRSTDHAVPAGDVAAR
jgi:hypothetical protein